MIILWICFVNNPISKAVANQKNLILATLNLEVIQMKAAAHNLTRVKTYINLII